MVVSSLFSEEEVATFRNHFMALRLVGSHPGDSAGVESGSADPLKKFPRMIHMHRWDEVAMNWLIDAHLRMLTPLQKTMKKLVYALLSKAQSVKHLFPHVSM